VPATLGQSVPTLAIARPTDAKRLDSPHGLARFTACTRTRRVRPLLVPCPACARHVRTCSCRGGRPALTTAPTAIMKSLLNPSQSYACGAWHIDSSRTYPRPSARLAAFGSWTTTRSKHAHLGKLCGRVQTCEAHPSRLVNIGHLSIIKIVFNDVPIWLNDDAPAD
jgi:hypothetical protein